MGRIQRCRSFVVEVEGLQGFGGAEGFGLAGLSAVSLLQEGLTEFGKDGVRVVVEAIVDDFFDGFTDAGFDELAEFVDGEVFDLHGVDGGCGAVGCVLAAIDFRDSGYVNTAKTHRYHIRFVRDIFGALRRSIRYRF